MFIVFFTVRVVDDCSVTLVFSVDFHIKLVRNNCYLAIDYAFMHHYGIFSINKVSCEKYSILYVNYTVIIHTIR